MFFINIVTPAYLPNQCQIFLPLMCYKYCLSSTCLISNVSTDMKKRIEKNVTPTSQRVKIHQVFQLQKRTARRGNIEIYDRCS